MNKQTNLHKKAKFLTEMDEFEAKKLVLLFKDWIGGGVQNEDGESIIHFLTKFEFYTELDILLTLGFNVNYQNIYGESCLHLVNDLKTFEVLRKHGINIHLKNENGETAKQYLQKFNFKHTNLICQKIDEIEDEELKEKLEFELYLQQTAKSGEILEKRKI